MADYTRYRTRPDDMPRHGRARRQKTTARKKRKLLWLKITAVVVLLLVIIVLGMAAGAIFALSRNLPSLEDLRKRPNAVNTTIYDRHGALIAELHGAENRVLVTSKGIPEVMKQATVATEDARFYTHHGVDFQGVVRAVVENIRAGGVVQGGSTITEQYVKSAYVGSERTYTRKLREAVLAWQLEDRWSKDKILTEYLNTVYYGAGAYGVEAAALTYFHKHASAQPAAGGLAGRAAQVPHRVLADHRPEARQGAPQPRAAGHGRPGLHHAAESAQGEQEEDRRLPAPAVDEQRHGRLLHRLRHGRAHQTLRHTPGVRGRPQGVHEHRHDVAARSHRRDQEHDRAAELRLQALRGPRRHRPQERLHPHHGRRPGLQEAEVQSRHAGQASAGLGNEAVRAHHGRAAGYEPRHHLLQLEEPQNHLDGRLCGAVGRERRRARRAGERLGRHDHLRQRRLRAAQHRRRPPEHGGDGAEDGYHQSTRRGAVHHARHLGRHAARDGRRLRDARKRRHPSPAAGDRQGRVPRRQRRLEAQDEGPQGHPGRRRQRRHAVSGARGHERHRLADRLLVPLHARRQDRHHGQGLGRVVRRVLSLIHISEPT